jgi:hypothetical protein
VAYRITGPDDPGAHVEFEVPIKGRSEPLKFTVPKLHYFPKPKLDSYSEWMGSDEAKNLVPYTISWEVAGMRKLLEIFTTKAQYAVLGKLLDGQLLEISHYWKKESEISFPESSASADS